MYLLNETTTDLLGQIKAKLEAKSAPWDKKNPKKYGKSVSKKESPCSKKKLSKHDGKSVLETESEGAFSIGEDALDLLDRIRLEMMDDDMGDDTDKGDNETDVDDALDMYLDSIVERLVTSLGAEEDMAIEFIMLMADEMEEQGVMPPMPGTDSMDDETSLWMGAAKTSGFANKVLEMANAI
jgi:hypothetical protein